MPRMILIMGAIVLMSGAAGVAQAQDAATAPLPDSAAAASISAKQASEKAAQSGGKSESSSVTNADPGNDPPSRDAAHDNSLGGGFLST